MRHRRDTAEVPQRYEIWDGIQTEGRAMDKNEEP